MYRGWFSAVLGGGAFAGRAEEGGGRWPQALRRTVQRLAGVDRAASLAPPRGGEVPRSALDASRAELHLGWKPWTDLPSGTASVLEYFRTR